MTTLRLPKVMLLVGRSSKNTDVRHHIKLLFLKDVPAKIITFGCLKSSFWEAILKYLVDALRNCISSEAQYILNNLKNLKKPNKLK